MKSFKEEWTVTFLKSLLAKYKGDKLFYLCTTSPKFKRLWEKYREQIRKQARKFLASKHGKMYSECRVNNALGILFGTVGRTSRNFGELTRMGMDVRVAFIEYEIERLSKQNKKFEEEWTLSFVRKLRREFGKKKKKNYFCDLSPKFQKLWGNTKHRFKIVKLADRFHKRREDEFGYVTVSSGYHIYGPNSSPLFWSPSGYQRRVRIAFLDHEIKRLKSK
jgi:uncharacterized small protein (DUF1192 family)